jgi:N-acetylglutamate synthase-like GNAT family acetyltransferase
VANVGQLEIRRAKAADAESVHEIVFRTLRESDARDYPSSVIDRLILTLPERVASKLEDWHAYVAVVDGHVVGTESLNGQMVSSVVVDPDRQSRHIGTKLMDAVEDAARARSERTLGVQTSITAQPFYAGRGFKVVRESLHGEERTIVMSKDIPLSRSTIVRHRRSDGRQCKASKVSAFSTLCGSI